MPRRADLRRILIIGSGPIVIGQACEFDYSGTQAVRALRDEGYEVILVNSNPATIMTDPELADKTYIEPITADRVAQVIARERPDAILPTMGGQTALNCALELDERGILKEYGVTLIGASVEAIKTAEDRELFRLAMEEIGLACARSGICRSLKDAEALAKTIGYPLVLRPSRTLGGTGGGIVRNPSELYEKVLYALSASPNHEVLIEESLLGWKEIELEVMRDMKDNVVIVCSIENFDPMGVHTGDSITVAPIQTLTDKEYQRLRDAAIAIIRRIGVDTGGSNVQFALNPDDGRMVVIEMNPRVSRSSALASKATGFPIAKIAAKLAVGYTLDEIENSITKETPACFEPSIDYVVVKIPRFNFEKFPLADTTLGTQMKSIGEVLSFGRTFQEALQKAVCSMELGTAGFDATKEVKDFGISELEDLCRNPKPRRLWYVAEALRQGSSVEKLYSLTGIDPWFLSQMEELIALEEQLRGKSLSSLSAETVRKMKSKGFSDARLAALLQISEAEVRRTREALGVTPSYRFVDTCAGEFEAYTPYLYSSYDEGYEKVHAQKPSVIILGSGPNRIGQGIEFDYCCVHAVMALREAGYEAVMVNCNPETVSTDYDTSDRLYFEPLTLESVLAILQHEQRIGTLKGVIVQLGGQTPLKLARQLEDLGIPILGTSVESIEKAEDRKLFHEVVKVLGLRQPEGAAAGTKEEAFAVAKKLGFPVMIRPSFVLGGRAMRVLHSEDDLAQYLDEGIEVSGTHPVLLDRYLDQAIEVDVDAICDGTNVIIAGVMEHIERAGVHSGDSSCTLPPHTLSSETITALEESSKKLALHLKVQGLLNVQYAVKDGKEIYVLEANPRASRTVPFVSKATGVPWAKVAALVMAGSSLSQALQQLGKEEGAVPPFVAVKACVFPFNKFPGVDIALGPEMKSTGEVMGIDSTFSRAFLKAMEGAQVKLPQSGKILLSVSDADKGGVGALAKAYHELGFEILATEGTAKAVSAAGVPVERVNKVAQGSPHVVDILGSGDVCMVVNTPSGGRTHLDSRHLRVVASQLGVSTFTTLAAAEAAAHALRELLAGRRGDVCPLQEYHAR